MDLASLVQKFPLEVWRFELPEQMILRWWDAVVAQAADTSSGCRCWADPKTSDRYRSIQPKPLGGRGKIPPRALLLVRPDFVFFSCITDTPGNELRPSTVLWTFSPAAMRLLFESAKPDGLDHLPEKSIDARLPLVCLALLLRQIESVSSESELLQSQLQELHEKVLHIQKIENLGLLTRNIAHDLNNLLSPIVGYAQFLITDLPKDSQLRRYAELIEKAAVQSESLLEQLVGYAPVDKIQFVNLDLRSLIEESISVLARRFSAKQVRIKKELPETALEVEVIPDKILEALALSLLNALDASPKGGAIEISTRHVENDAAFKARHSKAGRPAYYQIIIKDHGPGMPSETLARAYDPFFTTKAPGPGVGLGLPITDGILRYHKGFTELSSTAGRGTEFRLFLPVATKPADIKQKPAQPAQPVPIHASDETLRVLLVEDEPQTQEVIAALLERRNCKVTVAGTGEEALGIIGSAGAGFDLILLDIVMPGMGGYQTFLKLREMSLTTPVILSTGYAKDWHVTEMLRLGVLGILRKPYSLEELSNMLRLIRPKTTEKAGG